jgi:hypothetical protein
LISAVTFAGTLTANPAAASTGLEADSEAVELAELVEQVAPDGAEVVTGELVGTAIEATADGVVVDLPIDSSAAIELAQANSVGVATLEVALPEEVDLQPAVVAPDGSLVYEAADDGASAVVQVLDDGSVRLQTVSPDADSPTEFTYSFGDNTYPVLQADGSVELFEESGGLAATVGEVAPAWAFDADGQPVPTHYEVLDGALVQVIEPGSAASYPIVADPKLTSTWWNKTIYFNRNETNNVALGAGVTGLIGALIPAHPVVKGAIAAAGGSTALVANWAYNRNQCLKIVIYGWPPVFGGVVPQNATRSEAGGYCK